MRTQCRKDSVLLELENLVDAALFIIAEYLYVVFLKYIFQLTPLGGEHAKGGKVLEKSIPFRAPFRAPFRVPLPSPFVRPPSFDPLRSSPFFRSPSFDPFRSIPFVRSLSFDPLGENTQRGKFSKKSNVPREDIWSQNITHFSTRWLRALSFEPFRSSPFVRALSFDPLRALSFDPLRALSFDPLRSLSFVPLRSPSETSRSIPSGRTRKGGKFSKKLNVPREDNWSQIITHYSICRLVKPSKCSHSTASRPMYSLYAPLW